MLDLTGFNDNQIEAVKHIDGACCVMAGAGSGKTKVLTYRIANLIENGIPASNILAVTFTKKASDEMKERLNNLIGEDVAHEVTMGTFHSVCFSILKEYWGATKHPYSEVSAQDLVIKSYLQKKIVKDIMQPPSQKFPNGINLPEWQPRQALSFIGFQKNNLIPPTGSLILNSGAEQMEQKLRKLYTEYEKIKKSEKKLDFDDMLVMCHELLRDNPNVLEVYKSRFKYILVDEYQDTNTAQYEILKLLAGEHRNLFVVGDDYQSIYGFRASRVELIINFEKEWNARLIPLDINYRSTANIVDWSNKLIANNKFQYPKEVKSNQKFGKDPVIMTAVDEDEEAYIISKEIQTLMQDGYTPKDFAILYRTNAQSRALEEAMMKAKIPYVVIGSASFYDRREIKDMLAYLRLSQNPDDDMSLERIINTPNRFLGKSFIDSLKNYANTNDISLFEALNRCPLSKEWRYQGARNLYAMINQMHEFNGTTHQTLNFIRKVTDYDSWFISEDPSESDDEMERLENLNALSSTATKYRTVKEFLEYVDTMSNKQDKKDDIDKVKLMTVHRSKGLEFPVVFVAGVGQDLMPHRNAVTEENIEEERRLMYVAMTRAKRYLYMSYTETYQQREGGMSMFLEELIKQETKREVFPWM